MSAPGQMHADDVVAVETPESVAFRLELAGLGSRGLALLIDTAVIVAVVAIELLVVLVFTYLVANFAAAYDLTWSLAIFGIMAFLTYWGYFIWFETTGNGRTWGKKRVGLRVVRDDGSRIGFMDSAIRNLVRIADALPGMYGVGIVTTLITKTGKRLGDLAAGTIVIRDRGELDLFFDGGDWAPATALAREFLQRRGDLTPEARLQVATSILAGFGEEAGSWTEPVIAGRLAELSEWTAPPPRGLEIGVRSDDEPAPTAG